MTTSPHLPQRFVGIDIAATSFTTAWTITGERCAPATTWDQTPDGFARFLAQLATLDATPADTLVVMEATSTYWVALAVTLHQAGYVVSVINPFQAHHVAKALLRRAKTDAVDAQTLALLALRLRPAAWTPPPLVYLSYDNDCWHAMPCSKCASRRATIATPCSNGLSWWTRSAPISTP